MLLSGLPGAGKDHYAREELADFSVISLDALREEHGISPVGPQGEVVMLAREQAREHLSRGEPFAWNATSLTREIRAQCVRLFAGYGARVRIVYLEVPEERLRRQNRDRAHPVPEQVLDRLLDRWEVPELFEAHAVHYRTD